MRQTNRATLAHNCAATAPFLALHGKKNQFCKQKKDKMKRIIISSSTVNGRGFRVDTKGISLNRYRKNPVLLWMHQRGTVIGQIVDIRVEDGMLTGEPVFDCATPLSQQLKAQYEAGSIRACSMGIDVFEVVEEPISGGSTIPVVTQCELFEISLVDVPENPESVTLRHEGQPIGPAQLVTLAKSPQAGSTAMAVTSPINTINNSIMNLQELALLLGLAEGATEDEVKKAILTLLAHKEQLDAANEQLTQLRTEVENVRTEQQRAQLAHVERMVDRAISEQRINAAKRDHYIDLGKKIGNDALESIFDDMPRPTRIVETLDHSADGNSSQYRKLSDVPADRLVTLRKEEPERYARLYEAEYGIRPEVVHD